MTLEDLKKADEMVEKFGSSDCKIYLRQRNKRTQYETESATFLTEFSNNGRESYIEIVY